MKIRPVTSVFYSKSADINQDIYSFIYLQQDISERMIVVFFAGQCHTCIAVPRDRSEAWLD
jgi:hypothetical protein